MQKLGILGHVPTCFAHRNPQLLQRSLCPLGPLRHSGVFLVWQLAQSLTCPPAPFLLFLFLPKFSLLLFLVAKNDIHSA